jgi:hypothetical protein
VYESIDGGTTWSVFGTGLPNAVIGDLVLHPKARVLRAATRNRGVWEIPIEASADITVRAGTTTFATTSGQLMYTFVVGRDGHLWANWYDGSKWQWADQGQPPPAIDIVAGVGAATAATTAGQTLYAFVIGADGHLWSNWWNGSSWQWSDEGVPPGTAAVEGIGSAALSGTATTGIYAFVRGGDGHLWTNWSQGGSWQWYDLGRPSDAIDVVDGIAVTTTVAGPQQCIDISVRGGDGHLWVNRLQGTSTQWSDHGQPSNTAFVSTGVGAVAYASAAAQFEYTFLRGSDGHLWADWYDGTTWKWGDQGPPQNTIELLDGADAITFAADGNQLLYAFGCGDDGHLYANWWDGHQWQWGDQGQPSSTTRVVEGAGTITFDYAGTRYIYVFVRADDGHLWVSWWNGSQWQWANQGVLPGA